MYVCMYVCVKDELVLIPIALILLCFMWISS